MLCMAKKPRKSGRKPGPKPNRTGKALNVFIPPAMMAAFESCIDSADPRTDKTKAVQAALRQWMQARGCWPPASEPGQQP